MTEWGFGPDLLFPFNLKQQKLFSPVLEVRSPKPRCQQGWFLLEAVREAVHAPLLASGGWPSWASLAYRGTAQISASVFPWNSAL